MKKESYYVAASDGTLLHFDPAICGGILKLPKSSGPSVFASSEEAADIARRHSTDDVRFRVVAIVREEWTV